MLLHYSCLYEQSGALKLGCVSRNIGQRFAETKGLLLGAEAEPQAADTGEIRDGLYYNVNYQD